MVMWQKRYEQIFLEDTDYAKHGATKSIGDLKETRLNQLELSVQRQETKLNGGMSHNVNFSLTNEFRISDSWTDLGRRRDIELSFGYGEFQFHVVSLTVSWKFFSQVKGKGLDQ